MTSPPPHPPGWPAQRQNSPHLICGNSGYNPLRSCQAVLPRGTTFPTSSHTTDAQGSHCSTEDAAGRRKRIEAEAPARSDVRRGRNGTSLLNLTKARHTELAKLTSILRALFPKGLISKADSKWKQSIKNQVSSTNQGWHAEPMDRQLWTCPLQSPLNHSPPGSPMTLSFPSLGKATHCHTAEAGEHSRAPDSKTNAHTCVVLPEVYTQ